MIMHLIVCLLITLSYHVTVNYRKPCASDLDVAGSRPTAATRHIRYVLSVNG